eukprot:RCo002753
MTETAAEGPSDGAGANPLTELRAQLAAEQQAHQGLQAKVEEWKAQMKQRDEGRVASIKEYRSKLKAAEAKVDDLQSTLTKAQALATEGQRVVQTRQPGDGLNGEQARLLKLLEDLCGLCGGLPRTAKPHTTVADSEGQLQQELQQKTSALELTQRLLSTANTELAVLRSDAQQRLEKVAALQLELDRVRQRANQAELLAQQYQADRNEMEVQLGLSSKAVDRRAREVEEALVACRQD